MEHNRKNLYYDAPLIGPIKHFELTKEDIGEGERLAKLAKKEISKINPPIF